MKKCPDGMLTKKSKVALKEIKPVLSEMKHERKAKEVALKVNMKEQLVKRKQEKVLLR